MSVITVESRMKHAEEQTLQELAIGERVVMISGRRRSVTGGSSATVGTLTSLQNWDLIGLALGVATLTDRGRRVLAEIDQPPAEAAGTNGTSQP